LSPLRGLLPGFRHNLARRDSRRGIERWKRGERRQSFVVDALKSSGHVRPNLEAARAV